MNLVLAQLNPSAGDIEQNKNKIIEVLKGSKSNELTIFPELFIYGYHNFDMLKKFPFIFSQIENALEEIKSLNKPVLVGYPELIDNEIKSSFALIDNEIKKVKTFSFNNKNYEILSIEEVKNPDFKTNADILICPILSISKTNKEYFRNNLFKNLAIKQNKKVIFLNQIGAIDEFIYDGASRLYDEKGEIIALAKSFEEDILNLANPKIEKYPSDFNLTTNLDSFSLNYENDLERTYKALILSIKDYFSKNGFTQAVLGLSGGLDSTICAVLLADALGAKNVLGVSMPSKLTSNESKFDGKTLADNLSINYIEAPIKAYHDAFSNGFDKIFTETSKYWCNRYTSSFTQDNIQARSRAIILWGIANEYGSTLSIATSDKSETYMGYATINGDMSGGFAPILDVTKTKLFALARWMNKNRPIKNAIPENIILKPPGAELALDPNTGKTLKAEDALMPYEFMDEVIWVIENTNQSIDNMMQKEFLYEKKNILNIETKKLWLEKFFKRMNSAIYKWYISAPSPIVDSNSINKAIYNQPIVSKINYLK
ncbi:MAG: NAD(+) synthase [Cyanobacteria bacterium SIG27]|nr:NAD(+) synthase [Cyanobacteria bacterium SIG27]